MNSQIQTPHILLVEDESHLAAGLKLNFELEGYAVDVASCAKDAAACLLHNATYDLIVLDVMLPDKNGFELCKHLREAGHLMPIIMLTARSAPHDRIVGLDAGADDYLSKQFQLSELLARVRSQLRRRDWARSSQHERSQDTIYSVGPIYVNFCTYEVLSHDKPLKLTQIELDLLRYFLENPGRVITREELLEKVWKFSSTPNTRTVDNFIVRLRRYFETDPLRPSLFLSVRGAGYKFNP